MTLWRSQFHDQDLDLGFPLCSDPCNVPLQVCQYQSGICSVAIRPLPSLPKSSQVAYWKRNHPGRVLCNLVLASYRVCHMWASLELLPLN